MIIAESKTIQEIQYEFHARFPGLKIEFYSSHHEAGKGSPIKEQLDPQRSLKSLRTKVSEADFLIKPEMTVAEFEQAFHDDFGLNVQVFRKSGNLWMQTTSTDGWTLASQNRKGGSSEQHYKEMND